MKQYKTDLSNIDFHVSFTICVREIVNETERYNAFGYATDWDFFSGLSLREGVFGWNGSSLTVKGIFLNPKIKISK